MSLIQSENRKARIKGIIGLILVTLFIIGFIIFFMGVGYANAEGVDVVEVDVVNVIGVRNGKILVDYSEYSNGEETVLEINKPFWSNAKEGDKIHVRYPTGNPSKMHCVINSDIGLYIIVGVVIFAFIFFMLNTFVVIIQFKHFARKR